MHGAEYTGVTLQTLDHKSFDHGTILAQTPSPGIKLDLARRPTFTDLLNLITPVGAEMLANGIRDRIFVPPLPQVSLPAQPPSLINAPKIKSEDKEVDWLNWDTATIARRHRALGPLWNTIIRKDKTGVRIKLDGIEEVELPWNCNDEITKADVDAHMGSIRPMRSVSYSYAGGKTSPIAYVDDGEGIIIYPNREDMAIRVSHITVEGQEKKPASLAAETFRRK